MKELDFTLAVSYEQPVPLNVGSIQAELSLNSGENKEIQLGECDEATHNVLNDYWAPKIPA